MNRIEGMDIRGLTLTTENNFNSLPGLKQWNDARERVELTGGLVSFWGDKSAQGNNFTQYRADRRNSYQAGLWLTGTETGRYLSSARRDYRFLHNGSKFGVYAIQKPTWSLAATSALNLLFTGQATGGVGLQGRLSTEASGRAGFYLRGGATPTALFVDNLLNPSHANYSPSNIIYTSSFVNLGQTLGLKATFGNAVATSGPFYPTLAEYPTGDSTRFTVVHGNTGITVRVGLLLIYDWTGYTGAQVAAFDAEIMSLLNKEKLIFQNLDV